MDFGYYTYPWNLHEPTSDVAAMKAAGMTHITVAASYHAGKFLQPRDTKARVYFPEDGTVYFRPQDIYGRLKPQVAQETRRRDVLAELCGGALPVRAWTVLLHNSRLGGLHPDLTAQNAWGDRYIYSLCPSQPAVREYAVALCTDLAEGYRLESLLLETPGWVTYAHGYHHEFAQLPSHPWLDGMMGLCFCPACRAGARMQGIDADGLARRVRMRTDSFLANSENSAVDIAADRANDPDLGAYLDWRCEVVASLCREIRAAVRSDVKVRIISTCQRPHATMFWEGGDLAALDAAADGLELPVYQPSRAEAEADLRHVMGCIDTDRVSVILRPGFPDMSSEAQLSDTIAMLMACGICDVSFYNYGLLPARSLEWVERVTAEKGHLKSAGGMNYV